jgi:hypothetical protein
VAPALQLQVQQLILTEPVATVTAQLDETKVPRPGTQRRALTLILGDR